MPATGRERFGVSNGDKRTFVLGIIDGSYQPNQIVGE
jgi:hypothetical protein